MSNKGHYTMLYKCFNCYERYNVDIDFGHEALINMNCPNCGRNECNPLKQESDYPNDGYVIKGEQLVKA